MINIINNVNMITSVREDSYSAKKECKRSLNDVLRDDFVNIQFNKPCSKNLTDPFYASDGKKDGNIAFADMIYGRTYRTTATEPMPYKKTLENVVQKTQTYPEENTYIDTIYDKGVIATTKAGITNALSYTLEKITGMSTPAKIAGAMVGAAASNIITQDLSATEKKEFISPASDYIKKYASQGISSGLMSFVAAQLVESTGVSAALARPMIRQFGPIASAENIAKGIAAIVGAGASTAISTLAIQNEMLPDPSTNGEKMDGLSRGPGRLSPRRYNM